MTYPRWLYYILKKDGRSGKIVNGVPTYTGIPTPLPNTPQGWQEINLAYERPVEKHGLTTQFGLQFGHVLNGAHLLRDAIYNRTTEDELELLIQRLKLIITDTTYDWYYKYFTKMEIDLSASEDEQDIFKAPLLGTGLEKLIKAGYETVHSFPMNDPEAVNLEMDGIELEKKGSFILVDGLEIDNTTYGDSSWAPFPLVNSEGSAAGIALFSQDIENTAGVSFADKLLSTNFFAKAAGNVQGSIDLHITGKIVYECTEQDAANGLIMRFLRSNQDIGNQNDYLLFTDSPLVQGTTYTHDIDITIPLQANERCYLEMILGTTGVDTKFQFSPDSKLSAEFGYTAPATIIKAFRRSTLLIKLIKAITGSEDYAKSDLCTEFDDLLITCGDAIRGIEAAVLKTSLSDFFKDCDSTLMAGEAIIKIDGADKYEIEDREYYYPNNDDSEDTDLGEATDFEIQPAKDLKCNTFKFGHQKQNIEDVNGKYDPNGNNQFTGPLTKDIKEYNMVSPYKSGPYEIELLRLNLEGKTTTDNDSDNDVFVIAAEEEQTTYPEVTVSFSEAFAGIILPTSVKLRAGQQIRITGSVSNDGVYDVVSVNFFLLFQVAVLTQPVTDETDVLVSIEIISGFNYILNRPVYDTLEGVPTDTIFNLPYLTPKTMLKRHIRWIASMNAGLETKKIKFSSDKDNKNSGLKTVLGSVTVDEDAEESFAGAEKMFQPFYAIFKASPLIDLPELLEENPNRIFSVTDENGYIWRGFLRISGLAANEYTPQEWRLLLTPDNDMTRRVY